MSVRLCRLEENRPFGVEVGAIAIRHKLTEQTSWLNRQEADCSGNVIYD